MIAPLLCVDDLHVAAVDQDQRLLETTSPDHLHIVIGGRVARSGGMELAEHLERSGPTFFSTEAAR